MVLKAVISLDLVDSWNNYLKGRRPEAQEGELKSVTSRRMEVGEGVDSLFCEFVNAGEEHRVRHPKRTSTSRLFRIFPSS